MGGAQVRWGWVGERGEECLGNGGDRERVLSKLSPNIDRRSYNDGTRELVPVFHNH